MALSSSSKENISLKKLVGKSHTSNAQEAFNENKTTGLTLSTTSIFGDSIPSSPSSTSLHDITGSVEYVRLTATPLQESSVNGRFHAFKLSLPAQYETDSSNTKSGTAPFTNSTDLHSSTGGLQLVPPNFSSAYEAKVYYGSPDVNGNLPVAQRIFLLDERSWYLDYFSGILFQETPPGSADLDPTFVEAYIYIGDMANQKISSAASTGGSNGASNLNGLQDVTIGGTGLAENQVLVYTSSNVFENQSLSSSQLSDGSSLITTSSSISSLGDVNTINGIADGNVLSWVAANNQFEFTAPAQTYTDEMARNAVGIALQGGDHTGISFTNNNDGDTIDAVVSLASTNLADSNLLARLADPDFTGTPTAPTALTTIDNTQIATTAFVHALIDSDIAALNFGDIIESDIADFLSSSANINDLSGVSTTGATQGQILKFNSEGNLVPQDDEGKTQEEIEDLVGAMIGATTDITVTYNDNNGGAGNISYSIDSTIARLNSPALTGSPTAPTTAASDNSTSIATTAYTDRQVADSITALNLGTASQNNTTDFLRPNVSSINELEDVNTTNKAAGKILKFNSDGDLIVGDDTGKTQEEIEDIVGAMVSGNTETDITVSYDDDIGKLNFSADNTLARINSPSFTGTPTSVTPAQSDNSTKIATTAYVDGQIDADISSLNLNATYQPLNNSLTSISSLTTQQNQIIYTTAANTYSTTTLTPFARTLLDDTTSAEVRSTLSLGTASQSNNEDFLSSNTSLGGLSNVLISNISNAQILVYDSDAGENDNQWKNVSLSGDISISNDGVATIQENAVENSMIQNSFVNFSDGTNIDKINLGETLVISGTANQVSVTSLSDVNGENANGTISVGLPDDVIVARDLTVTRNLEVTGNLTINGTSTTLNTTNLDVEDSVISLNNGLGNVNNPANKDIGFYLDRGSLDPALIFWDEADDVFKLGTHTGNITSSDTDLGDSNSGFTYAQLNVKSVDQSSNDNAVATTSWVNTKVNAELSSISINDLTDVDTTAKAEGKILKFNSNGNLVAEDENIFEADTSSLWEVSDDGTELYPHGIIDGTLDTGMFAIQLSAGSIDFTSLNVTLYDVLEELSNLNAYTPSTRDQVNISDTYWEFDIDGNIMPKAAV